MAERLIKTTERGLLIAFWLAFLGAGAATAVPQPYWIVVGGATQLVVAVVWLGYAVAVFHCFAPARFRSIGVAVLLIAVTGAFLLVRVAENSPREDLWSLVIFVLFWFPFIGAAYGLRTGEKHSFGRARTNLLVSAFAFFALPFLGAFIHSRVKAAILGLQHRS